MNTSSGGGVRHGPANANAKPTVPSVVLVGTSYRTAGIDTREGIAKRLSEIPELEVVAESGRVLESTILETCNRLELYFVCGDPDEVARSVTARLSGGSASSESFFVKTGIDAIRHIFRVASGLDSPVLGEEQILEQVREAGRTARTARQAKSILSSLFDAACSSGKRIRESYKVSSANTSVSAFALRHALKELGIRPTRVLLIGSGETAKLAALRLRGSAVYLLSARRGVEARFPRAVRISHKNLRDVARRCDMIIAATKHHGYVLTRRDLPKTRKLVILDLGFPRNVDPSIKESKFVRLYNLDDVARWALLSRLHENSPAEKLVWKEARRFDAWLIASRLSPTLANIYKWAERIREEETLAALRRLPTLSAHDKTIVEALGKRLTGKLLSPHATFVKEVDNKEEQSKRLLLLESVFRDGKWQDVGSEWDSLWWRS